MVKLYETIEVGSRIKLSKEGIEYAKREGYSLEGKEGVFRVTFKGRDLVGKKEGIKVVSEDNEKLSAGFSRKGVDMGHFEEVK